MTTSCDKPDLTCVMAWGKIPPADAKPFCSRLQASLGIPVQCWQGFRDTEMFVWTAATDAAQAVRIKTRRGSSRVAPQPISAEPDYDLDRRIFDTLKRWGDVRAQGNCMANFVLREIDPQAVEDLMPKLCDQMSAVASQDGCLGTYLGAERGAPSNLLGITFWQELVYFEHYMQWAMEHPWRDVITPVTLNVPLRLLTRNVV